MRAEQKGRIVVERILDGSNAALGGLQIGDVIRGTTARSKVPVFPNTLLINPSSTAVCLCGGLGQHVVIYTKSVTNVVQTSSTSVMLQG